ncbi:glutathione-dependent formaldehyde dehydrogenase [Fulvivirga maritima]|uniref:zinc-dependent alcohol dehydrogenase n=1 Tax=Fulvivirga maritima TaxID=2904247 RepID=UPI001F333FC5|nr:zinc-dependent alcohol dehydrogenase [Fulvivirga maritima]UII25788.1 glutathione-dependent formaldehyde dehydrogenase [Fulvivirga maritima]
MKALCWHGKNDVRIDTVPDPIIQDPDDVILKVTSTAICGSDLHLLGGLVPTMQEGDILGHEFMGEVVDLGKNVTKFKKGDRVVVPFTISCGHCSYCESEEYSLCDNSNPEPELGQKNMGHAIAGIFGYSHMTGGYSGGQAEYVRVPYSSVGPVKVPDELGDEKVLFLSDIFPTGYMAAVNADIKKGDVVAVWGCGPVGQFTIKSAWMLGASRVIAIDSVPERLKLAETFGKAETISTTNSQEVYSLLMDMTGGKGPDCCIDAVGAEAHGTGKMEIIKDEVKDIVKLDSDHPYALEQIIKCCKKGGNVSVPGVYVDTVEIPFGAAMNKSLTFRMGQTHVQAYLEPLLNKIKNEEIDPSSIITHRLKLEDAPNAYETFRDKKDGCIKVVMTP